MGTACSACSWLIPMSTISSGMGMDFLLSPGSRAAAELLRPLMDEVSIDRSGSVIGVRHCGKPNAKRLLLDAHIRPVSFPQTPHGPRGAAPPGHSRGQLPQRRGF